MSRALYGPTGALSGDRRHEVASGNACRSPSVRLVPDRMPSGERGKWIGEGRRVRACRANGPVRGNADVLATAAGDGERQIARLPGSDVDGVRRRVAGGVELRGGHGSIRGRDVHGHRAALVREEAEEVEIGRRTGLRGDGGPAGDVTVCGRRAVVRLVGI